MAAGLTVVPPEEGWRAAPVAADFVIGDHGSVTQYGAALGVPVLMNAASAADAPDAVPLPTVLSGHSWPARSGPSVRESRWA